MSEHRIALKDLACKAKAARKDVADVAGLRKQALLSPGASFLVQKTLFVFVPEDLTPDDGVTSVRPESISEGSPGRFRRTGFARPAPKR